MMRFIVGILWIILMVFIILVILNTRGIRLFPVRSRNLTWAGVSFGVSRPFVCQSFMGLFTVNQLAPPHHPNPPDGRIPPGPGASPPKLATWRTDISYVRLDT